MSKQSKKPFSLQVDVDNFVSTPKAEGQSKTGNTITLTAADFLPATPAEKQRQETMRESVNFFRDGMRRLRRNVIAMISLIMIILIMIISFIVPNFYPYSYDQQIRGSENLAPMELSKKQMEQRENGEFVWPHILGTDNLGRDTAIRVMIGSRVSLLIGIVASVIVLIIGSTIGAIAGYFGGVVDLIIMRIIDIIYTVPDLLIIILLTTILRSPLRALADSNPSFKWINEIGAALVSIFIVFILLYWVGMARIIRGQILSLKEQEFVTAAKALGAKSSRIIRKHLLRNCIGIIIVTTTLQIPSAIFTESFLSFMGIGVTPPMTSLGLLTNEALKGINSYPHRLIAPALMISLIILSFNLLGDGLRDAFDPKMKHE